MSRTRRNKPPDSWYYGEREMWATEGVHHSEVCKGKVAYPTRARAKRARKNMGKVFGRRFRVYACPH